MNYKRSEAKEAAKAQFRGVWAAITTPFTPDDRLDEGEALAVERAIEPARVGDRHLGGLERDEVLLVRVGVEIGPPLGALGVADRGAHVGHAGSNSSVSIVGRIAS